MVHHNGTAAGGDDTVAAAAFNMNITDNQTSSTPFPSSSPIQEFDFEDINSLRERSRMVSIFLSVNGSISFLCSCAIMYHILRTHQGLSKTYHRLVFGLCVADLLSSFAFILSSTMVPTELSYISSWAKGNVATCSFQGFLLTVGNNCAAAYNCSICFYYLAIVTYNKQDAYITKKLEPWFHAVAVVVPMTIGITLLFLKACNSGGTVCGPVPYNPPHCSRYEKGDTPEGFTIPCGRGDWTSALQAYSDSAKALLWACAFGFPILLTPFVIIITMIMMYRSLLQIEKKLQRYGVNSLHLKALRVSMKNKNNDVTAENDILPNFPDGDRRGVKERCCRFMSINLKYLIIPSWLGGETKTISRSNRARSQKKRSILYMAVGFALAWAFTWLPYSIDYLLQKETAGIISGFFTPFQGLFNLIVYMAPIVRNAKNSKRQNVSWCQAMLKAWKFKGEQRKEITGTQGTNASLHKTMNQWMKRITLSRLQRRSPKTTTQRPSSPITTLSVKAKNRFHKKNEENALTSEYDVDDEGGPSNIQSKALDKSSLLLS